MRQLLILLLAITLFSCENNVPPQTALVNEYSNELSLDSSLGNSIQAFLGPLGTEMQEKYASVLPQMNSGNYDSVLLILSKITALDTITFRQRTYIKGAGCNDIEYLLIALVQYLQDEYDPQNVDLLLRYTDDLPPLSLYEFLYRIKNDGISEKLVSGYNLISEKYPDWFLPKFLENEIYKLKDTKKYYEGLKQLQKLGYLNEYINRRLIETEYILSDSISDSLLVKTKLFAQRYRYTNSLIPDILIHSDELFLAEKHIRDSNFPMNEVYSIDRLYYIHEIYMRMKLPEASKALMELEAVVKNYEIGNEITSYALGKYYRATVASLFFNKKYTKIEDLFCHMKYNTAIPKEICNNKELMKSYVKFLYSEYVGTPNKKFDVFYNTFF